MEKMFDVLDGEWNSERCDVYNGRCDGSSSALAYVYALYKHPRIIINTLEINSSDKFRTDYSAYYIKKYQWDNNLFVFGSDYPDFQDLRTHFQFQEIEQWKVKVEYRDIFMTIIGKTAGNECFITFLYPTDTNADCFALSKEVKLIADALITLSENAQTSSLKGLSCGFQDTIFDKHIHHWRWRKAQTEPYTDIEKKMKEKIDNEWSDDLNGVNKIYTIVNKATKHPYLLDRNRIILYANANDAFEALEKLSRERIIEPDSGSTVYLELLNGAVVNNSSPITRTPSVMEIKTMGLPMFMAQSACVYGVSEFELIGSELEKAQEKVDEISDEMQMIKGNEIGEFSDDEFYDEFMNSELSMASPQKDEMCLPGFYIDENGKAQFTFSKTEQQKPSKIMSIKDVELVVKNEVKQKRIEIVNQDLLYAIIKMEQSGWKIKQEPLEYWENLVQEELKKSKFIVPAYKSTGEIFMLRNTRCDECKMMPLFTDWLMFREVYADECVSGRVVSFEDLLYLNVGREYPDMIINPATSNIILTEHNLREMLDCKRTGGSDDLDDIMPF